MGRRKSGSRCDKIFCLHVPRQRGDAALVSRYLFCKRNVRFCRSRSSWEKRSPLRKNRLVGIWRNLYWSRSKSAAISVSYLVAGRVSSRADWRVDGIDGLAFEDGSLRYHVIVANVISEQFPVYKPI